MSKSGVQREVLNLFRKFMREVRKKPLENQAQFREVIYSRFYQDANIPKTNFAAIEYQLDLGKRRLQQFQSGQLNSAVRKPAPTSVSNSSAYGPPSSQ